jgi:hypothetical protein
MGVMRRPYEIMAECELFGFPTAADVARVGESLDRGRRAHAQVVRATVLPPAAFRDGRYVLQARFLVWADHARGATKAVEDVIAAAGLASRLVLPTGRALSDAEVPSAPAADRVEAARPGAGGPGRRATPRRAAGSVRGKGKGGTAKRRTAKPRRKANPKPRSGSKPGNKRRGKR